MTYSENPRFNAFVKAYITAMLWSTSGTDADGEEFEDLQSFEIAPETVELIKLDCFKFYEDNFITLSYLDAKGKHSFELSGHDFWLTRAGHGVGFWDRGLGIHGEVLTTASKNFEEVYPTIGDDNLIYL